MLKAVCPDAWDFDQARVQLVKVSSRGVINGDRRDLIKSAGVQFADTVRRVKLARDESAAHLIAMGAHEYFGPNRNGDGFREEPLLTYYANFVKRAKPYRDHNNRPPSPFFGRVIDSVYNRPMHRVDLLVGYNGGKDSIEKNGGLLADLEVNDLESGREFPVSMACSIPYDVCSGCGNKARTRADYCTEATCKYGGLRDHIGTVYGDGHHLHADNPVGLDFFDISRVKRGADRTAWSLGKVASGGLITSLDLAESHGLSLPYWLQFDPLTPSRVVEHAKCAEYLAGVDGLAAASRLDPALASPAPLSPPPPGATLPQIWRALADVKIAMTFEEFVRVMARSEAQAREVEAAASSRLPGIYKRSLNESAFRDILCSGEFAPSADAPPSPVRRWAESHAAARSLASSHMEQRLKRAAIQDRLVVATRPVIKSAGSESRAAETVAMHFAAHRACAVAAMSSDGGDCDRFARLLVRADQLV
jgi:hypothetical protein